MKITLEDLEKQIEIFFNNLEKVETFDVEKSLLLKYFSENEKTLFTSPYAQNVDISKYAFDGGYVCYVNNFVLKLLLHRIVLDCLLGLFSVVLWSAYKKIIF